MLKARWTGGDPDLPLRGGPAGEEVLQGLPPGRDLQRDRRGRDTALRRGMHPEQQSPVHQDALGHPGLRGKTRTRRWNHWKPVKQQKNAADAATRASPTRSS